MTSAADMFPSAIRRLSPARASRTLLACARACNLCGSEVTLIVWSTRLSPLTLSPCNGHVDDPNGRGADEHHSRWVLLCLLKRPSFQGPSSAPVTLPIVTFKRGSGRQPLDGKGTYVTAQVTARSHV